MRTGDRTSSDAVPVSEDGTIGDTMLVMGGRPHWRSAKCPSTKRGDEARRSAANLRFGEALVLAECLGFEDARTKGSHLFKRAGLEQAVDLQTDRKDSSKAKKRQVEQLLKIFDDPNALEER